MFMDSKSLFNGRLTCVALLAVCGLCAGAAGGPEKTKVTTWQYRTAIPDGNGQWKMRVYAEANCSHDQPPPKEDNSEGTWGIIDGLSLTTLGPVEVNAKHASGKATARVAVTVPKIIDDHVWPWVQETSARNKITTVSTASFCSPSGSKGYAYAASSATWASGKFMRQEFDGQPVSGAVSTAFDPGWYGLEGQSLNGKSEMQDPIILTLYNESDNHHAVWSETLFRFDAVASFDDPVSGWGIDENGLTIASGANDSGAWKSKVLITGETASPWLINPLGAFSVSLEGGVFQSTGYWSSLWQLTTEDGRVTSAFLPLANLPFAMEYAIPNELLNDSDTYSQSLSTEFTIDELHENVPAPGVCTLMGLGILGAVSRRRR